MEYNSFLRYIKIQLERLLGPCYQVDLFPIPKNNGIILDGLTIRAPDSRLSPTIHMNSIYNEYLIGKPIDSIPTYILDLYKFNQNTMQLSSDSFCDFNQIKNKIAYKLIHYNSNLDLLSELPYRKFLDLAIIFYICLEQGTSGNLTTIIYKDHLKLWEIHEDELFLLANINTPKLFPYSLRNMDDVIFDMIITELEPLTDNMTVKPPIIPKSKQEIYVLTNTIGCNGASAILYDNLLDEFAFKLNSDLVLLPSSIHEILILSNKQIISINELSQMVTTINQTQVPMEERLSNQIYYYSLSNKKIAIISNNSLLL